MPTVLGAFFNAFYPAGWTDFLKSSLTRVAEHNTRKWRETIQICPSVVSALLRKVSRWMVWVNGIVNRARQVQSQPLIQRSHYVNFLPLWRGEWWLCGGGVGYRPWSLLLTLEMHKTLQTDSPLPSSSVAYRSHSGYANRFEVWSSTPTPFCAYLSIEILSIIWRL